MLRRLLAGDYLQADETPIKCQDPDNTKAGVFQGYLWVVSRPGDDVCFDWRTSRRHGELTSLIEGFGGVLQSDGYEAYAAYERAHPEVAWVGCWAHARRKFIEAQGEHPKAARAVLKLIGRLYRLEREWDEADAEEKRERSRPKSGLGVASGYLLAQWSPLYRHIEYGQTRLDNNLVENAIRPTAVGKKNWLFIGHPDAGRRSAILYSLIVSCLRHGKDPAAYLRDVLSRLPAMTNQDDLDALTPRRWQAIGTSAS